MNLTKIITLKRYEKSNLFSQIIKLYNIMKNIIQSYYPINLGIFLDNKLTWKIYLNKIKLAQELLLSDPQITINQRSK
jgi:hypothetical protein